MNSIRIIEQFSGCAAEPDAASFSIIASSKQSRFDTATVMLHPTPSDIRISLRCPMKLSVAEAERLSGFISGHNAALHKSGYHLLIWEDHLCLRSSLYIEDISIEDSCDALGSMISAMMEKMTLIESGFLQCLFSADSDSSPICQRDSDSAACKEAEPDEEGSAALPARPAPYACANHRMDKNDCSLPAGDDFESYDDTDLLRSELLPSACEEPKPYENAEDAPSSGREDTPVCDAGLQPDAPPAYPDLNIDISNPRLRSLFAIQPIVNLRRELKRAVPAFDDLLRSGDQTGHAFKESEG